MRTTRGGLSMIAILWVGSLSLLASGIVRPWETFAQKATVTTESEEKATRKKLLLTTGEDRFVDIEFDANEIAGKGIVEGNPEVVKTQLVRINGKPRQLIFKPLKSGTTTVTIRDAEGNIRLIFDVEVTGTDLLKMASELRDLLRDIEGIDIRVLGNNVVIDGQVLVPSDYGRILNVLADEDYGKVVLNLTEISPMALQVVAKRIQQDVNTFAPQVQIRVVNNTIWLEGSVENVDHARQAVKVAELYMPAVRPAETLDRLDPNAQRLNPPRSLIQNFITVLPAPPKKDGKLVRVTVHFVELSKDYQKAFGFKWQPGFTADPTITLGPTATGATGADGSAFTLTATISSLFPKLQSAQNAGYARILKTGTLIVRDRQPATLNDEVEIPIVVQNPQGQVATSKEGVGLTVGVSPTILGDSEDIQLDLDITQKNLIGSFGSSPLTSKHRVKTKLFVKSKESAAVAGVTNSDVKTNFNKDDPNAGSFSGQTSPLFTLLRTKSYTKKKSQFVIFITPQIIENASDGTSDLKKNFRVKVN